MGDFSMKYKKIVLGVFIFIFLSYSISFFLIPQNSFETVIQNDFIKNRELRNSATNTAILRPNGDILTEWDGSPTPHWSRINEVSPDGIDARWIYGDENETEIYAMENLDIPNFNATKLYSSVKSLWQSSHSNKAINVFSFCSTIFLKDIFMLKSNTILIYKPFVLLFHI